MPLPLTSQQKHDQASFREFVQQEIMPYADDYDREGITPRHVIQSLAQKGYLGSIVPREWHGPGMDMITYGLLNEELGRACASVRSLLTVHSMITYAILRWGSQQQKEATQADFSL